MYFNDCTKSGAQIRDEKPTASNNGQTTDSQSKEPCNQPVVISHNPLSLNDPISVKQGVGKA